MEPLTNGLLDVIAKSAQQEPQDGDYVENGLWHCCKCHTPKECYIEILGVQRKVSCLCKCGTEQREKENAQRKAEQEAERIKRLRVNGIADRSLTNCRFENAQMTPELAILKAYADKWDKAKEENGGLLLWGGVGNGKTFAAACIVNALIDRGVPAMITSFPRILSGGGYDKSEIARQMQRYELVVIDDLGAERESDYALETVFMVIDERYKSGKPLIVTTNLTMGELTGAKNMRFSRIYDRVLEMCAPVYFASPSRRVSAAEDKSKVMSTILKGE